MTDKAIEKTIKRFIKRRPFKLVTTYDEATGMMVFERNDLKNFRVLYKDHFHEHLFNNIPEGYEVRYLKSTNPHDKYHTTLAFIKRRLT